MLSPMEQFKLLVWMFYGVVSCLLTGKFGKANCVAAWLQLLVRAWLAYTFVDGSWIAVTYVFVALLVTQFIGMAPMFAIVRDAKSEMHLGENLLLLAKMIAYPALAATISNLVLLGIGAIWIQLHDFSAVLYAGALLSAFAGAVAFCTLGRASQLTIG